MANISFDTDTHLQCAAKRADKPTPCGALPARVPINSNVRPHEIIAP